MDTTQIRFVPGQLLSFVSTRKFALGATGIDILEGMEVLFDGSTVEVNGLRFNVPQLRGSLKLGWLVPVDEYDPEAPIEPRMSANIQVRAAVTSTQSLTVPPVRAPIVTTESDERVVMTKGQRSAAANQATAAVRQQQTQQRGGGVARSFGGAEGVDVGGAEFGVPVTRSLLTPAKAVTSVTRESVGQAIMAADKVKVQPGQGLTEDQMLASMTDEQREEYLAKKESARAVVTARVNPNYSGPATSQVQATSANRVIGRVRTARTQTSEGVTAKVSTGGGTEVFDASGYSEPAQKSTIEVEGMRFTNTNGPKRGVAMETSTEEQVVSKIEKDGTADARKRIAKALCPDFPEDYGFSDHWKRRLATIRLKYESNHSVIRAIFAAESDDFKKVLLEEFPDSFAS